MRSRAARVVIATAFVIPALAARHLPTIQRRAAWVKARQTVLARPLAAAAPMHHVAIYTRNISVSTTFYSLLGFDEVVRFRAGPARAVWLQQEDSRLELLEIPSHLAPTTTPPLPLDTNRVGYHHVALNVTAQVRALDDNLQSYLDHLNATSRQRFNKTIRLAVPPRQQIIGGQVYELAFVYDPNDCLVELLHEQSRLAQPVADGWEPWSGQGFQP
jgi:catechol 2,3-dioxygenase-like lactoylglutathione lyase family enzyme